jgi:hypothetical protein
MKTRIKGAGNLSRKLITILMMVGMLSSGSLLAADNSIYIDQSGDFANVTINQDGAGNQVRGLQASGGDDKTVASVIRGNGVSVNINQVGSTNKLDLGINGLMAGNKSVDFTYSTVNAGNLTGSNNTGIFQLGNSSATLANSTISVIQVNGNNYAEVRMQGADNTLNALQSGGNASLTSLVNASGTNQQITTDGGTGNVISTTGHQAVMDINGSSNTVNLAQAGSPAANVFNLKVGSAGAAANTNTYNITQTTR